jgi:hypothetical protein
MVFKINYVRGIKKTKNKKITMFELPGNAQTLPEPQKNTLTEADGLN